MRAVSVLWDGLNPDWKSSQKSCFSKKEYNYEDVTFSRSLTNAEANLWTFLDGHPKRPGNVFKCHQICRVQTKSWQRAPNLQKKKKTWPLTNMYNTEKLSPFGLIIHASTDYHQSNWNHKQLLRSFCIFCSFCFLLDSQVSSIGWLSPPVDQSGWTSPL